MSALHGNLSDIGFMLLLNLLAQREYTGRLVVVQQNAWVVLWLRNGQSTHAILVTLHPSLTVTRVVADVLALARRWTSGTFWLHSSASGDSNDVSIFEPDLTYPPSRGYTNAPRFSGYGLPSPCRIVVTGSFASGKSHFVHAATGAPVGQNDVPVTDPYERRIKTVTTVDFDFGVLQRNGQPVYLYGTPGQTRFEYMWESLARDCHGYIVLVDSSRPITRAATIRLLARFGELTDAPYVVVANKQDCTGAMPPVTLRRWLGLPPSVPVLPCIATISTTVEHVVNVLLERIRLPEHERTRAVANEVLFTSSGR